jgi:hypothetical protein
MLIKYHLSSSIDDLLETGKLENPMSFIQEAHDVYDDIAAGFPIARDHMDQLAALDISDASDLPDAAFALNLLTKTGSVVRKFALKTPDDTAASVFYFSKTAERLPLPARKAAATFIKTACKGHGVKSSIKVDQYADPEIEDNLLKVAELDGIPPEPVHLGDENFALITTDGKRMYPIDTAENVKQAAAYFSEHLLSIPPAYRAQMAVKIARRATEVEATIRPEDVDNLEQYASDHYGNILKVAMADRRDALQHQPSAVLLLDNLMEKKAEMSAYEFAVALENFDHMTGLDQHWDGAIIDPYQSAMGGVKFASAVEINGETIYEQQLQDVAQGEKLAEKFGPDFATEFAEDPVTIFNSLPTPERTFIASLVEG